MTPTPLSVLDTATTEQLLLTEFHRAAMYVPAYGVLLREHGVRAVDVHDVGTFSRVCPLMTMMGTAMARLEGAFRNWRMSSRPFATGIE